MARYIDADKVSEKLKRYLMPNVDIDGTVTVEVAERYLLELINKTPTADVVEVKHGHFVRNERNIPKMKEFHKKGIATAMKATSIFYTCSCCNDWGTPIQKYCSGCGAKMNNVVNYESTKTIKIERRSE